MPQPDSIANLDLDREDNPGYFDLADTCAELEKGFSRLQRQIEDAPRQVGAGHRPRSVRRRLRADRQVLERRAEDWEQKLHLFLAQPYLALSGADRERKFSQALVLLREHSHRLAALRDRLARGLGELRQLKRPPRNHYLGKVAIFMAPIVLVLVLLYLYWGGYFNLPRWLDRPGNGQPAAGATLKVVAPASQPGALQEPAPDRPADSLDNR